MFDFRKDITKKVDELKKLIIERTTRKSEDGIYGPVIIKEQDHMDSQIAQQEAATRNLTAEIDLLMNLNKIDYKILNKGWGVRSDKLDSDGSDVYFFGNKAREWLREQGYTYKTLIDHKGELWTKGDKQ